MEGTPIYDELVAELSWGLDDLAPPLDLASFLAAHPASSS